MRQQIVAPAPRRAKRVPEASSPTLVAWRVEWEAYGPKRAPRATSYLRARSADEAQRSVEHAYPRARVLRVDRVA